MSTATKNELLPIYVELDKILVGYLSNIAKMSINEVVSTIRDLADKPLQRLRSRPNGCNTHSDVTYPNTNIKLRIKCKNTINHFLVQKAYNEYMQSYFNHTGLTADDEWWGQQWRTYNITNPQPKVDYSCLLITVEVRNRDNKMNLSDDDVALLAIESIFLGSEIKDERLEESQS